MAIPSGTKLGPYEVADLLGKGGMGEVYRARDERLDRDVAVKILPASFASDPERLQRFEQEARAAGRLSHPNVITVHDVGSANGVSYLVTELLDGEDLRSRLAAGPIAPRLATQVAAQAALGLAAAHAHGIVHRDLKPENLFITREDRVKVLDFGIAKLARREVPQREETASLVASLTETGAVLGTASYMAPEQIRAQSSDHRTDIFALGAILYEMLAGVRAFAGDTAADRMAAILHTEPAPLPAAVEAAIPGLGAVVRRCLEKRPEARFDSAGDLAFTLTLLAETASGTTRGSATEATTAAKSQAALTVGPRFSPMTFREGAIYGVRFAPDGHTVVYTAAWEGRPPEVYITRVENPEARAIGIASAESVGVSSAGELAIILRPVDLGGFISSGTLARVPMVGGVPRELLKDVFMADWSPDGKSFAVIHLPKGATQLEYPIGTVLYAPDGWLSWPRVSPDGARVAVLHHPWRGDNAGEVVIVDRQGNAQALTSGWELIWGLAWAPDGESLWFSGGGRDAPVGIHEVKPTGEQRLLHHAPGLAVLADVLPSGDSLIAVSRSRMRLEFMADRSSTPIELSWHDWSLLRSISRDGRMIYFDETGASSATQGQSIYIRGTDGSPAVRLGEGTAIALSPDGEWALARAPDRANVLVLHPMGVGDPVELPVDPLSCHTAVWFPDSKSICMAAAEPGRRTRLYRYNIEKKRAEPISDEGIGMRLGDISPDGSWIIATDGSGAYRIFPTGAGEPRPIPAMSDRDRPVQWTGDGRGLYVLERGAVPALVSRIDLESGARERWLEIVPRQRGGVDGVNSLRLANDGETCAYSYPQSLNEIYVVRGLGS